MRRPRRKPRIQVVGTAGSLANRLRVRVAKLGEVALHAREHHVAVVQLAEDLLEIASPPASDLRAAPEAELRGLEHVAKALRRDSHVVLLLDASGLEGLWRKRPHLVEP